MTDLFSEPYLIAHWGRIKRFIPQYDYLYQEGYPLLRQDLAPFLKDIRKALVLGYAPQQLKKLFLPHTVAEYIEDPIFVLPTPGTRDAILSLGQFQWINDPIAYLKSIQTALNSKGFFYALFPGGKTLYELRHALAKAETNLYGGASMRVMPTISARDAAGLLQQAGFSNITAEVSTYEVIYHDIFQLIKEVKYMGGVNPISTQVLRSYAYFEEANKIYKKMFSTSQGMIATFEVITLKGHR